MARPSQSKTTSTTLSSSQRGGRAMKNARSKMKMIDVAEVKGLKEEQDKNEEEDKRMAKRQKIKEMSGIKRKKGGWAKIDNVKTEKNKLEKPNNNDEKPSTEEMSKQIDESVNANTVNNAAVPMNNDSNFSTSINNATASNSFMQQQDDSIPDLHSIPINQNNFTNQNLEDPSAIEMKNTFHQGQLLHEQLLHEQHSLQNQNPFQTQNPSNLDQSNPHLPNFQFNDQLQQASQLQYNQHFPLNDALMHLQPQFYDQNMSTFDTNANLQSSFLEPPQQQPIAQNWHALLEKSNKLTLQDRNRIEQFFGSQYNPTPNQSIYRMKLHEEKKQLEDGSYGKETLYLELNYNTFEYKKLKKIKNY